MKLMKLMIACVSLAIAATAATAAPVAVIEARGLDQALADLRLLDRAQGSHLEDRALSGILSPLAVTDRRWIDGLDRTYLVLPGPVRLDWAKRWLVVATVRDADAAIASLVDLFEGHTEDNGLHVFESNSGQRYARIDGDRLIAGSLADAVRTFDLRELDSLPELPAGSLTLDVDMEPLSPMLQGFLAGQRAAVQSALDPQPDPADTEQDQDSEQGEATGSDMSGAVPLMGLYFDTVGALVQDVSRVQASMHIDGEDLVFRLRLVPVPGSTFAELMQSQPNSFSKLARSVRLNDEALIHFAANVTLTDGFRDVLHTFAQRYMSTAMNLLGSLMGDEGSAFGSPEAYSELQRAWLDCASGDMAGSWTIDADGVPTQLQLVGIRRGSGCNDLQQDVSEKLTAMRGFNDQPMYRVTDVALVHQGVNVMRYGVSGASMTPAEGPEAEEFAEFVEATQPAMYSGRLDNTWINTAGADAEEMFRETVDRLVDRQSKGGLEAERFAPLSPRAGIYATVGIESFLLDFLIDDAEPLPERLVELFDEGIDDAVVGIHSDYGQFALDVAFPLSGIEAMKLSGSPAKPDPRAGLWPADAPAEGERKDAPESVEGGDDGPRIAGTEGVTMPVRREHVPPVYPEPLRLARLEGVAYLQSVIRKDGSVDDIQLLACSGKTAEQEQIQRISTHSEMCRLLTGSAIDTVSQWTYEPATLEGKPVDVYFTVKIDYELQ